MFVSSRSTFLWRSTSMTSWQTAPSPLRVLKMVKRDWKRGKKQKSSVPGWIPGNIFFPFMSAHLFFSFFPPSSVEQRTKQCRDFLWVTRRWEANILRTLANHKVTLMSLIYDHFLWLGSKTTNRSGGPRLSPARAFLKIAAMALPNLQRRTVAMLKCVWPMPIFLLLGYWFLNEVSKKINSNQQIGGRAVLCQNPELR